MNKNANEKETVVLLHGILRGRKDMLLIAAHLMLNGYKVVNIDYPSRKMTLEEIADFLHDKLQVSDKFNNASKVHFVTHSMGGLVSRYYIHKYRPDHLGSVVMLSPPNMGSEFADWMMGKDSLKNLVKDVFERVAPGKAFRLTKKLSEDESLRKIYQWLFGPAGQQLRTDHEHSIEPKVDFNLGVIAGSASVNPLAPWVLGKNGDHDGVVPIERMKIDGMKDMITIDTSHTMMIYRPKVMKQIYHFLKHEQFAHSPKPV